MSKFGLISSRRWGCLASKFGSIRYEQVWLDFDKMAKLRKNLGKISGLFFKSHCISKKLGEMTFFILLF